MIYDRFFAFVFVFVLFCFVLFCFVLFCFVLFFVLFCFVLFCFVLFFCFVFGITPPPPPFNVRGGEAQFNVSTLSRGMGSDFTVRC